MNILALDTCTEQCSTALLINDKLFSKCTPTQRGHSDLVLAMLDELFIESESSIEQINALAFGRGPGSFTGVRVGVGVAQGIAFARDIPVIPVSTLASVAQQAIDKFDAKRVAVAIDARMGEIYAAHFENKNGFAVLLDDEQVCAPELFKPLTDGQWFAAGTGWREFNEILTENYGEQLVGMEAEINPEAASIIKLAKGAKPLPADQALPVYLRNNVAKKKGEQ
jgi:tRNA threonylcarbamoyladenosine biosynthesis protein TsaB